MLTSGNSVQEAFPVYRLTLKGKVIAVRFNFLI